MSNGRITIPLQTTTRYTWPTPVLIISCLPAIKLLQTCKTIRNEARPIFQRNQLERVASNPIRLFVGSSCSLNYTAYVEDIVLRIDSVVAPQHSDLGQWLHAHSWGPGVLPSGHALQLLTTGSSRKDHTRLIVCINFGVPPSDTDFWRMASYIIQLRYGEARCSSALL
jgi:hypothetical protein